MSEKKNKTSLQSSDYVSWAVFLGTITVVLIAVTTAIFPTLIVRFFGGSPDYLGINPFETGVWTVSFLTTNFVLLAVTILYLKNLLPNPILNSIRFIFGFEISAKVAFFIIIILIGIYISFTITELVEEDPAPDYFRVESALEGWKVEDIASKFDLHVKYLLGNISMEVFGNYRMIPFIASIGLLVLTYFITTEISQKRFAGIVSVVIVLQSGTFQTYDTSITYANFWVLLYILSLFSIYRWWPISPTSFFLSLFSKPLTFAFFPMTLFFIYRVKMPNKKKIALASSYGILLIGIIILIQNTGFFPDTISFDSHDFWRAFNAFSYQLRFDALIVIFLLPLTIGLFISSRKKGIVQADSILVLIMGMLLVQPILSALTINVSEPYRFMPLVIFFAMGVGTLLSKKEVNN